MARLSSSEKCLECLASTGVYTPVTMFPSRPADRPDRKRSSADDNRGDVDSDIRDDCKPVVADDKARAERLADSTGNGDPSLGGSGEEWEGFILSESAIQASRLCGAVSFETHEIFPAGNRDMCLMSCAAPRNSTPRITARARGVPAANHVEPVERLHQRV